MTITEEDIARILPTVPQDWFAYVDQATDKANDLTCGAFFSRDDAPDSIGMKVDKGATEDVILHLPVWADADEPIEVTLTDPDLGYNVGFPDHGAPKLVNITRTTDATGAARRYSRTVAIHLESVYAPSDNAYASVTATFGFDSLPAGVLAFIARYIDALSQSAAGDREVKTKSIEDVSATRFDDAAKLTPLGSVLDSAKNELQRWSFCPTDITRPPLGKLGYPTPSKATRRPWWLGGV